MIYFWKIDRLKSDLTHRSLSMGETLFYLACILAYQIISWLFYYATGEGRNLWDHIDAAVFISFLIAGTVCCFYTNGGIRGRHFLSRYLSLSWVSGVRYALMVILPAGVFMYFLIELVAEVPETTQWYDVLFNAILKPPFYFIVAGHIRDVAMKRVTFIRYMPGHASEDPGDYDLLKYPSISRRYIATYIDTGLMLAAFIALIYLSENVTTSEATLRIRIWSVLLLFYEPFFTSRLCTLGQKVMGIRVIGVDSKKRISIFHAYIRTVVKLLLGIISFFFIPLTRKRRALHDLAAGSVVIYAHSREACDDILLP